MSDVVEVDLGTGGGGGNLTALYLLKDHTNDTGLTAAIYLSDLSGSAGLLAVANDGTPSIDTSTYLTTASAAATYATIASLASYLTIASAAATYWPIPSLTNTRVLYATGAATVGQSAGLTYTAGTGTLNVSNITGTGGTTISDISNGVALVSSAGTFISVGAGYVFNNLGTGLVSVASGTLGTDTNTYLTTASAAATYLTIASAASTYLTQANAAATYLTITTAASTYAPIGATYITQTANGSLTSEQALSALSTGFVKVTTGTGVLTSDTSTYLTTASAAATYLTIATASSTYWPIPSLTNKDVLYATGAATVGQSANFQYDNTAKTLTLTGSGGFTTGPLVINNGASGGIAMSLTGSASVIDCTGDFVIGGNTTMSLSVATQGIVLQMSSSDDAIGLKQSAFKADGTQVVSLGALGPASLTSLTPSKWIPFKDRVGGTTYLAPVYASSL